MRTTRLMDLVLTMLGVCLTINIGISTAEASVIRVPQDFPTIQQAVNTAVAGDTVLVGAGVYSEVVTLKGGVSLHAVPGSDAVTINASGLTAASSPLDYVVGWSATSNRIEVVGFTLVDDNFSNGSGLFVRGSNHFIEGNTLTGQFQYGIRVEGTTAAPAANNTISGNKIFGTRRVAFGTSGPWTHAAISLQDCSLNRVLNNHARGGTAGIEVIGGLANSLGGNVAIAGSGPPASGIQVSTSGKLTVANNTAYADGGEGVAGLSVVSSQDVTVKNSMLISPAYGIRSTNSSNINVTYSWVNGYIDVSGMGVLLGEGVLQGSQYSFVSPSQADFRLLPGSPARNAGSGTDRDGSRADMGAYGEVY